MAKIFNERDFYFGAILSVLLSGKHTKYTPSLISSNNESGRIYEFSVDNEPDFILLMIHATKPRNDTYDKTYSSWVFKFTDEQLQTIKQCIDENKKIKIAYLCGAEKLNQSELAMMDNDDIINTIYSDGKLKGSVTIRRDKQKHSFVVFRGKSPKDSYQLKAKIPINDVA